MKMVSDLDIGGQHYGMREALQLRAEIMIMRDAALSLEKPNMHAAVLLSHTIALLYALTRAKWPLQFSRLAGTFEAKGGRAPQKYGDVTLDMEGVLMNMRALELKFDGAWYAFHQEQTLENWIEMNEGMLRMRLLADVARELIDKRDTVDQGGGHA